MAASGSTNVAAAINTAGARLLAELAGGEAPKGPGLFISPWGVAHAMAMLLNGAEEGGPSYRQISGALFGGGGGGGGASLAALNAELRELSAGVAVPVGEDVTVSDANSVWVRKGLELQQHFKTTLSTWFDAEAAPITDAAAVNGWVSKATRGKIKEIVDDGTLAQMALLLINAVYFKGLWLTQFDKNMTHPLPFHLLDGARQPLAAMMHHAFKPADLRAAGVRVARLDVPVPVGGGGAGDSGGGGGAAVACQLLRLPYRGEGGYAAIAALPLGDLGAAGGALTVAAPGGGTPAPYRGALAAARAAALGGLAGGNASALDWQPPRLAVKLWLPRFEITYSAVLNDALRALGVRAPFVPGDLTRLAAEASGAPARDLAVDAVLHKARAGVVHEPSGMALFAGEVHEPEEWKA
eukprot:scaffold14.g1184.t1